MTSYEHKVKNIYLWSPYNEWTPIIPGDYILLRWPCDEGFHVPLIEERKAIIDISISVANARDSLHMPFTWYFDNGTASKNDTSKWYYRASNKTSASETGMSTYYMNSGATSKTSTYRSRWIPIRAFKNIPIIPDNTRREWVQGKTWYNSDLWLISILVGTNQYVTMQDKNVGATTVYNYGDTTSETNVGKFFQRWNDYWFPFTWPTNTSSTQVDASPYWPNNHYSSDTFITWSMDWSSVQNDNLRWYTDFNS